MNRTIRTAVSPSATSCVTDLDTPLLRLTRSSYLTLRDAFNGIHVTGSIGSGKTSGSGKAVRRALFRAGAGAIVLTAKFEEIELAIADARASGRARDIVIFDERQGFNPVDYELARGGVQGLSNVTEFAIHALEIADRAMGSSTQSPEPFWAQMDRVEIGNATPLLYTAWGTVSIDSIVDLVNSAAERREQYSDPEFRERSFAGRTLAKALNDPAVRLPESELRPAFEYYFDRRTAQPTKTRGNVTMSLSARLNRLTRGRLKKCFSGRTTIVPEMTFAGAIIIVALPVLTHKEDGIIANLLWKYAFQRACEGRNALGPGHRERPVLCFADESQLFISDRDDLFLSTSRASRIAVVYMTQGLPSYFGQVGKDKADAVEGLLGKFNTHIWHLNSCYKTNKWASDTIGRDLLLRRTQGRSFGTNSSRGLNQGTNASRGESNGHGGAAGPGGSNWNHGRNTGTGENYGLNVSKGTNASESWSDAEANDQLVEPRFFCSDLLSGGPQNGNIVSAVYFRAGARFEASGGRNYQIVRFRQ